MTCLASKDNDIVDSSCGLVAYKLPDDKAADLSGANNSKVLVPRHISS